MKMIDFSEYGFSNYKILREDWNCYKLKDGSIISLKLVPIKLRIVEENEKTLKMDLNAESVVGILAPQNLYGEPGDREYGIEELDDSVIDEDIDFSAIEESWDEYELEDGKKLSLKLILTMASRTNKFDSHGEPIYITQTQLLTKLK